MCECAKCGVTSFLIGMAAGVMLVVYNKNVRKTLLKGKEMAEEKATELKLATAEKMDEAADKIEDVAASLKKKKD